MKTSKFATLVMMGLALSFTPALAQRSGGGNRGGGSHSSSVSRSSGSSGSSRSSSSFSSPSRSSSSSSRSSSSFSSPSRSSSSSSRSSSSFSSPSRSSSPATRSSSSFSSPSRSSASGSRSSYSGDRTSGTRSAAAAARNSAVRASGSADGFRSSSRNTGTRGSATVRHSGNGNSGRVASAGRSSSSHGNNVYSTPSSRNSGYARPGHPGVLPPSHRPIRPAPYFHHPWHGYVVHCRPIYWHPVPPRPWYWPGFWHYCHSYWYDYHVTDVVVVRQYVQETYKVDMVTYGISGDIMYAIVRDGGNTYLQVYDKDDHLLAEQEINKRYCNMVIDADNGGAWISKKNNKDALLFIWADGQLLIYEAE